MCAGHHTPPLECGGLGSHIGDVCCLEVHLEEPHTLVQPKLSNNPGMFYFKQDHHRVMVDPMLLIV